MPKAKNPDFIDWRNSSAKRLFSEAAFFSAAIFAFFSCSALTASARALKAAASAAAWAFFILSASAASARACLEHDETTKRRNDETTKQ
jgi:hypothetical protein